MLESGSFKHIYLKVRAHIAFILSSVLFVQCYNQVGGDTYSTNADNVIYVDALLKNNCSPEVRLTSAVAAYSSSTPEMLTDEDVDANIYLGEGKSPLHYEPETQVFTNRSLVLSADEEYTIEVISKRADIEGSILASTAIPEEMTLSQIDIEDKLTTDEDYVYNVALTFDHEETYGEYYYLEPINRIIGKDGLTLTPTNDFDQYTINNVFTQSNFIRIVDNNHGLLIDNMSGDAFGEIALNISLNKSTLNPNQAHNHIYFRLYHITEDYYMYLKSGGTFNTAGTSWFVEPVIQHSNVVGGRGIVGGASIALDSILIN